MRGFGNLGGLGNMGNIMKQAQKMMEQQQKIQEELENQVLEGSAGGGMVTAQVNGLGRVVGVTIDPQVVDPGDVEMLQDLVLSAFRDAVEQSEAVREEKQKALLGGMGLPPGMF